MQQQQSIKTDRCRATVRVITPGDYADWHLIHRMITANCYENEYRTDDYRLLIRYYEPTKVSRTGIQYITARPARDKDDPAQLEDRLLDLIRRRLMDEGWRFGHQVLMFPQPQGVPA